MSAMSNIVVYDGAPTPVSHTLNPLSVESVQGEQIASYRETIPSVPDEAQVRATLRKKKMGSGVTRTVVRVEVPTMEAIGAQNAAGYTAAPKVAFSDTYEMIGYHHPRSTPESRRLARQLAINFFEGEPASRLAYTTGPVPELCDLLISPT